MSARHWALLAALTLVWGVNWTAMKVALADIAPWTFRAICLAAGAGVLFAVLAIGRQPLAVPRAQWGRLVLVAFFTVTCWNLLVAFGLRGLPSGRAVVLSYSMPLVSIPLAAWWLKERVSPRQVAGLALGVAGIGLLLAETFDALRAAPLGVACALGAAVTWGVGTVLQKKFPIDAPLAGLTAWLMLVGGIPIYIGAALFDAREAGSVGVAPSLALAYNVFVSFAFGYWAWIRLVQSVSVAVFSISMLLTPVVGIASGMAFLGERPTVLELAATALVLSALALAVAAPDDKEKTA